MRNERGLTLVELLAVIVILGIIAAIAVPAIGNIIEKSKVEAHNANVTMINNAMKLYKIDHSGAEPSTLEELEGYVELPLIDPCTREPYPDSTQVPFQKRTNCNGT